MISRAPSILVVVNYLNQQKHLVCGLFNPPYFEADIIVLSEFVENLGRLVIIGSGKAH
jgi:hypothetical protein